MSELLTIDSISVSYGNIKALRTVSMHVDQGDIVCLIGANGAGKSTLLKAIVGLEPITTGTYHCPSQCQRCEEAVLPSWPSLRQ